MQFKKAVTSNSKLRLAMFGPAGSGKTMSALRIATGMVSMIGGRIAVLDTENGSASKYADRFDFDVANLVKRDIDETCAGIKAAANAGYSVIIIDSLSHSWQELLEYVDKLAQVKYRGNSWWAWIEGTPKQRALSRAILDCPCHIIATMRSKTKWLVEEGKNGKTAPKRIGIDPEQGKDIEYDFDMLIEMSVDHIANVLKDRTSKFQDQIIDKPSEEFGKELASWLTTKEPQKPPQTMQTTVEAISLATPRIAPPHTAAPQQTVQTTVEAISLATPRIVPPPTAAPELELAPEPNNDALYVPDTPANTVKTTTPLSDKQKATLTVATRKAGLTTGQVKRWCRDFLQSEVCAEVYNKLLSQITENPIAIKEGLPF